MIEQIEIWHILFALGFFAILLEIFSGTMVFVSVGIGLLISGVGAYVGLSMSWIVFVFVIGLAVSYFLIKPLAEKMLYSKKRYKTNHEALIGKRGRVIETINNKQGTGRIAVDGDRWQAQSVDDIIIEKNTQVEIVKLDSIVVYVKLMSE